MPKSGSDLAPRSIAFDLDGTLIDPREGIVACLEYALERLDVDSPDQDELAKHIGPPLADTFRTLLATDDEELVKKAVSIYRERFAVSGIFENAVYPGVSEALDALRAADLALFAATSKPTNYARKILTHLGIASSFKQIYGAEMDGRRADKAELIKQLIKNERLDPATLVVVGDRKHDIVAAHANGARAIGVLWGYGSFEELDQAGADLYCRTPGDLPGLLIGAR